MMTLETLTHIESLQAKGKGPPPGRDPKEPPVKDPPPAPEPPIKDPVPDPSPRREPPEKDPEEGVGDKV